MGNSLTVRKEDTPNPIHPRCPLVVLRSRSGTIAHIGRSRHTVTGR